MLSGLPFFSVSRDRPTHHSTVRVFAEAGAEFNLVGEARTVRVDLRRGRQRRRSVRDRSVDSRFIRIKPDRAPICPDHQLRNWRVSLRKAPAIEDRDRLSRLDR
jgi:hypothetical protein